MIFGGGLRSLLPFSTCVKFKFMAPTVFPEKDFSRILSDVNGYGHVFLDRIRELNWHDLVFDNSNGDVFYYPAIVKKILFGHRC